MIFFISQFCEICAALKYYIVWDEQKNCNFLIFSEIIIFIFKKGIERANYS
jgi:hypothetical protein